MLNKTKRKVKVADDRYLKRCTEAAFEYLNPFFDSQDEFIDFLDTLNDEQIKKFLHLIHFYWAHDVFRNCTMSKSRPLDIFSVLTTLSIVEFLMKQSFNISWDRVNNFFSNYLKPEEIQYINDKIQARNTTNKKDAIRILYEMRSEFVHNAQWFYLHNAMGFATIDKVVERSGNYYVAVIKLSHKEYLDLFWKAFLRSFGMHL